MHYGMPDFVAESSVGYIPFHKSLNCKSKNCAHSILYITKYSSTLYIGMDEVLAHYACTFENSDLHFHFQ